MSVMVTLEIPVYKEKLEGFLDVLREALKETRVYEGCQKVETFVEMETASARCLSDRADAVCSSLT